MDFHENEATSNSTTHDDSKVNSKWNWSDETVWCASDIMIGIAIGCIIIVALCGGF